MVFPLPLALASTLLLQLGSLLRLAWEWDLLLELGLASQVPSEGCVRT